MFITNQRHLSSKISQGESGQKQLFDLEKVYAGTELMKG